MKNSDVEMNAEDIVNVLEAKASVPTTAFPNIPCAERGASIRFVLRHKRGFKAVLNRTHFSNLMEALRKERVSVETAAAIGAMVSLHDDVFEFSSDSVEAAFSELDHPDVDLRQLADHHDRERFERSAP